MEKWVELNLMLWVKEILLCQTLCKHLGYFPGIILLSWSFKYLMGLQRVLFHVPGQTFRSFIKLWISKFSPGNKDESYNHGVINGKKSLLKDGNKSLIKLLGWTLLRNAFFVPRPVLCLWPLRGELLGNFTWAELGQIIS